MIRTRNEFTGLCYPLLILRCSSLYPSSLLSLFLSLCISLSRCLSSCFSLLYVSIYILCKYLSLFLSECFSFCTSLCIYVTFVCIFLCTLISVYISLSVCLSLLLVVLCFFRSWSFCLLSRSLIHPLFLVASYGVALGAIASGLQGGSLAGIRFHPCPGEVMTSG